jgi:pSer/pThr/pTyr-binding forkhead associated (FHA) protein
MTTSTPVQHADPSAVMLTILSGPESGVVYKLMGQTISVGRDAENDVVLQDIKASRKHATMQFIDGSYLIKDLGSQNGILINGKQTTEGILKPGDQLVIGSTLLRFGSPQSASLALINSAPPFPNPLTFSSTKTRKPANPDQKPKFIPWVIGALVIILGFLFLQNPTAKKKKFNINDDEAVESQIEDISTSNETKQQELNKNGHDTQQYRDAQSFYQRGFREFREGGYTRAMQNFEAALAIYPSHPLAKRYLDRSRQKIDELVAQAIERGEKDFQNERYTEALNEYRTVLILRNDDHDKMSQLALKRTEAINLIFRNNK